MDAAAKIDAVGAVVYLNQHPQRVGGAGLPADGLCHPFGRYEWSIEADGGGGRL